jgi:hypothetical protein
MLERSCIVKRKLHEKGLRYEKSLRDMTFTRGQRSEMMTILPSVDQIRNKKMRRLKECQPLTIAIASLCVDGLVICSDQQASVGDFKFYQRKSTCIPLAGAQDWVMLAYAGTSIDTMKTIYESLRSKLEFQHKEPGEIEDDLQSTLNRAIPRGLRESHQLLCGFREAGVLRLLKTLNKAIYPVKKWDCIGIGDSALTRYLGGIFLDGDFFMPAFRVVPICVYLVAQAKKYIQWCGGPTDLMVLFPDGKSIQYPSTTLLDSACERVEQHLNGVLTAATDPSTSPEEIQSLIDSLRAVIDSQMKMLTGFLAQK